MSGVRICFNGHQTIGSSVKINQNIKCHYYLNKNRAKCSTETLSYRFLYTIIVFRYM